MTDGLKEAYKDANSKFRLAGEPIMITCCKCHGKGVYGVSKFDYETLMPSMTEWEDRPCEVCKGTGKISLQFYEDLQKGCRR